MKYILPLMVLAASHATQADEFVAFVANEGYSEHRREFKSSVCSEYGLTMPKGVQSFLNRRHRHAVPGLPFEEGRAFYISDGNLLDIHCYLVKDQSTFERIVQAEIEARSATFGEGASEIISISDTKKIVSATGPVTVDARVTIRRSDGTSQVQTRKSTRSAGEVYFVFEPGVVIVGGDKSIFKMNLRSMAAIARKAAGKLSFYWMNFSKLSRYTREQVLSRINSSSSVSLQQRTNERSEEYQIRRALGEELLKLYAVALDGLEEFEGWVRLPTENKDYQSRYRIKIRDGSKLAKMAKGLRATDSRHALPVRLSAQNTIGSAFIQLGIPPELGRIGRLYIENQGAGDFTAFDGLIEELLKLERVDARLMLGNISDQDHPLVTATVATHSATKEVNKLIAAHAGLELSQGTIPFPKVMGFDTLPGFDLHTNHAKNSLQIQMTPRHQDSPEASVSPARTPRNLLAEFKIDLRKWAPLKTDSMAMELIGGLASTADAYVRSKAKADHRVARYLGLETNDVKKQQISKQRKQMFLDRISPDGSFSGESRLEWRENSLEWSSVVGRDLYRLIEARRLAAMTF